MMDRNFFDADPWQTDTYAPTWAAHEKNAGADAQSSCNALLGFGLPASSGKTFVDKLWSAGIPNRLLGRSALHARAAPRERHVPPLVLTGVGG